MNSTPICSGQRRKPRRHRTGDDKPAVLPADHSPDEPVPPAPREDDPALISALELQTDLGLGQR